MFNGAPTNHSRDAGESELLLFNSKVNFLQRLAQTDVGASALLDNQIMQQLSNAKFIDLIPDDSIEHGEFGDR
jgi:hypothetical protein